MTVRMATKNAMIPIGTFRKKIDCQPRCSTIRPPSVGPSASARPDTPAHRPMAFARSCGGNVTVMIDSVPGRSNAAPMPWIARNTTSRPVLPETPQPNEASGEHREPGEEHLLPAVAVAQDAAGQEQRGERQHVAVDDPLESGDACPELLADRGEGDVHDRVVEHDHREREAHGQQDDDLLASVVSLESEHGHLGYLLDLGRRHAPTVRVPQGNQGYERSVPAGGSLADGLLAGRGVLIGEGFGDRGRAAERSESGSRQRQQEWATHWLIAPQSAHTTSCMAIQEVSAEPGAELSPARRTT